MRVFMRGIILVTGVGLAVTSACKVGPSVETYTAARSPEGIRVDARTRGDSIRGEVIDVRDTALVALSGGRLVLVPWALLRDVRFTGLTLLPRQGRSLTAQHRALVKQLSRFPQGMTPEIEARFLAHLKQDRIGIIER